MAPNGAATWQQQGSGKGWHAELGSVGNQNNNGTTRSATHLGGGEGQVGMRSSRATMSQARSMGMASNARVQAMGVYGMLGKVVNNGHWGRQRAVGGVWKGITGAGVQRGSVGTVLLGKSFLSHWNKNGKNCGGARQNQRCLSIQHNAAQAIKCQQTGG